MLSITLFAKEIAINNFTNLLFLGKNDKGEIKMEIASLVLSAISTLAAVVSAIAAIGAKNEVKKLRNSINGNGNTQVSGDVSVSNSGNNRGVISGVNSGEINM